MSPGAIVFTPRLPLIPATHPALPLRGGAQGTALADLHQSRDLVPRGSSLSVTETARPGMCRPGVDRVSLPLAVLLWWGAAGAGLGWASPVAAGGGGGGGGGGSAASSRLECPEVRRSPPAAAPGPSLLAHTWPPEVKQALGAARGLWAALDQPGAAQGPGA
ncbi:Amiloride-sensitive sodium channel subunit alpha, partial [Frankliniella fusca]